ncbi:response regulator [Simiduia sp. 21SJ11W-1]|uniref:response regulator n=1 Tax=Simiduia sp. 21SJ11W-1 TaxID=2909669 RepID=UPI00209FDEFA|nr:response regulator [Simiduia sp. 21SJ11W-1]UTA49562.1 response regulator [Simiduia sp. 21SJ11W-1]
MLIDDDEADNYIHKRVIEKSGKARVTQIFNMADDALQWFSNPQHQADCIFLDINMPAINGFEFLENYLQLANVKKPCSHTVMLTSSIGEPDKQKAKAFGVLLEHKPLTTDRFISITHKLICDT